MNLAARADFTLRMKKDASGEKWDASWKEAFLRWLDQPEIMVMKKGKKTLKEINIRPLVYEARFEGEDLLLGLSAGLDRNIRPELVMQAFAQQTGRAYQPFLFSINRDEVYADRGKDGKHAFVALIDLGAVMP